MQLYLRGQFHQRAGLFVYFCQSLQLHVPGRHLGMWHPTASSTYDPVGETNLNAKTGIPASPIFSQSQVVSSGSSRQE